MLDMVIVSSAGYEKVWLVFSTGLVERFNVVISASRRHMKYCFDFARLIRAYYTF